MRHLFLLMTAARVIEACSQTLVDVDTIRAVQPWAPNEEYTFPRLVTTARPFVAARINRHLCAEFLEVDPDTAAGRYFEKVWGDTVGWTTPRLSYLEWNVRQPMPNLLEVELSGEGCGAYCEGFMSHYHYDLRDGRYLGTDTLFTPVGATALMHTLHALWKDTLTAFVTSLMDSVSGPALDVASMEELRAMLEMYQQCLDERAGGDPYVSDFIVETDGIRFFTARCAPHVEQELDVLEPLGFALPYAECWKWMREDMRALFP